MIKNPTGGVLPPVYTKIMYNITIAITNKYFEFHTNRLKIIHFSNIARDSVLYHCDKQIKNFR